jgi:hypothetical protein
LRRINDNHPTITLRVHQGNAKEVSVNPAKSNADISLLVDHLQLADTEVSLFSGRLRAT